MIVMFYPFLRGTIGISEVDFFIMFIGYFRAVKETGRSRGLFSSSAEGSVFNLDPVFSRLASNDLA